jgi:hypothetical protein
LERPHYADQSYDLQALAPGTAEGYSGLGAHYATDIGQGAQTLNTAWNTTTTSNDGQNFGNQPQFSQPGPYIRGQWSFERPSPPPSLTSASTGRSTISTSPPDEIDIATIVPANYQLPSTHVVQTLNNRYIRTSILTTALDAMWPENWAMVVSVLLLDSFFPFRRPLAR